MEDCPDGICSAWIVYKALASFYTEVEVLGQSYLREEEYLSEDWELPFDPNGKDIVMVDFAYPVELLEGIAELANKLTVINHHKSRMDDLSEFSNSILNPSVKFDLNECGATLTWNHFFSNEPMPWFLQHVRNRDIGANGYFEGEARHSEEVTMAIQLGTQGLKGKEAFSIYDELVELSYEEVVTQDIMEALDNRDEIVDRALNNWDHSVLEVGSYTVPIYYLKEEAWPHCSIVGSKAAKFHKHQYPFVALVCSDPLNISLRAALGSTVDLSTLAKSLGGGGHPRAAGYRLG